MTYSETQLAHCRGHLGLLFEALHRQPADAVVLGMDVLQLRLSIGTVLEALEDYAREDAEFDEEHDADVRAVITGLCSDPHSSLANVVPLAFKIADEIAQTRKRRALGKP